jgi:Ca-activated chloride channel family protein
MIEAEAGVFDKLAQSIAATGGMSSGERKQTMNDAYMQKNQQAPLTISDDVSGDQQ